MRWEAVPDIPFFADNTAAFVHELARIRSATPAATTPTSGSPVPTPVGVLDRDKKLGVVREMTEITAAAAGDPSLSERTWVLISEAPGRRLGHRRACLHQRRDRSDRPEDPVRRLSPRRPRAHGGAHTRPLRSAARGRRLASWTRD